MAADRPLVPAVGGTREVPEPDPIAADYLLLGLRLDQHTPGSSMATSGRPRSRPRSTWSSCAPRPGCARTPRRCARAWPTRSPSPTGGPGWTPSSWPSRRRPRPWPAIRCRIPSTSRAAWGSPRSRRPDAVFDAARAAIDAPAARRRLARRPARRLGSDAGDPGRPAAGGHRLPRRALSAPAPRSTFGLPEGEDLPVRLVTRPAVERLQLVRRRPALAGRRQHGPAGPRPRPRPHGRPRDLPGPPPRARLEGGRARRPARSAGGQHPAHQHARVPVSARAWPTSASSSPTRPRSTSTCWSRSWSAAVSRWRRTRPPPGPPPSERRPWRPTGRRCEPSAARPPSVRHADGASHEAVLDYLVTSVATRRPWPPSASSSSSTRCGGPTCSSTPTGEALLRRWVDAVPPEARTARFGRLLREQVTPGSILAATG